MHKVVLLLIMLFAVVGGVSGQAETATRVFEPLDRSLNYRFSYPLETHSVRTTNLYEPLAAGPIVYGALAAVEPNDSYLYAGPNVPESAATQMRILAIPLGGAPESLAALVGTLPLWQRDMVNGEVREITLGGQPAVRVDDPDWKATEIISYYGGVVYQIVIDVVPIHLGFRLSNMGYDPVYDDILASWEFVDMVR